MGALRRLAVLSLVLAGAGVANGQTSPAPPATVTATAEVFVQTGHALNNTIVRFSRDGRRIASCDGLGAVVGWDAASGRQFRELHRHTGVCMGLDFTPDGQAVVSSGGAMSGNEVSLTRWVDGVLLQRWSGHLGFVVDVVATAGGRGAWSLGENDGLKRWQLGTEGAVQVLDLGADTSATRMVIDDDQTTAFVALSDGRILRQSLAPGAAAGTVLARLPESVSALALSPDGTLLAVAFGRLGGATQRDVLLLDARSGAVRLRLIGHLGNVAALAFSPDGALLASAAQIDLAVLINGGTAAIARHEALRLWRVEGGALLAEVGNQRKAPSRPFLRGALAFAAADPSDATSRPRLALAMWDEALRVFDTAGDADRAAGLRLAQTLEGGGIAPTRLVSGAGNNRLLVAEGPPRNAAPAPFLRAADLRREFGTAADWIPERQQRADQVYGARGLRSGVQRASVWDLSSGRLERVLDWQRGPASHLGLDARGRFTSVAPIFPHTVLLDPLKTRLVREAAVDADGEVTLRHFGYEPWDGPPDALFNAPPSAAAPAVAHGTDLVVQSPTQRWMAVAAQPIGDAATGPRLFVQQRLPDGRQVHAHDIAMPGPVLALAVAADERSLWASGTASGLPYNPTHQAWLIHLDLNNGQIVRRWDLASGITVDHIAAHPAGRMAVTNGGSNLSIWDRDRAERRYFVKASESLRVVRGLAMSSNGQVLAAADASGWMVLWDWPADGEPVARWRRQLALPSPHVLGFVAGDQRLAAGASDGSTRLLEARDGAEVARMHRFDNDEWITIIPEGYFVASQDGDRLLNVRRGDRVYGIDQFYDAFYRPDIVQRRLAGLPIDALITTTLQDALQQPPPQVTLAAADPAAGGTRVRLTIDARSQGGGVGEVRLLHNGKLVEVFNGAGARVPRRAWPDASAVPATPGRPASDASVTRALRLATVAQVETLAARPAVDVFSTEIELALAPGENVFSAIAFNGPGHVEARPVSRSVVRPGTPAAPRVFVLALGIDVFRDPNRAPTLLYAAKDAGDMATEVRRRLGATYSQTPVVVKLLRNEQATRAGLDQALAELRAEVRESDILLWFVASHGMLDNRAQYGIVLQDWDGRLVADSLFSSADILDASRRIKAFNQVVILDTCHAGGVNTLLSGLYDARLSVLARNMGLHVFASASASEEALDGYEGNGLFTHHLLKGLRSDLADRNGDRRVSVGEWGEFARRETQRIAKALRHSQQPLNMSFGKDLNLYAVD